MAIRPISPLPPPPDRVAEPVRISSPSSKPVDRIQSSNVTLRDLSRLIDRYMYPRQEEKNSVDWKDKTEKELEIFVNKTSMFVIAHLMYPEIKYEDAIKIVIDAYNGNHSIYDAFKSHFKDHPLSLFAKCRAAALYFIFYSCGIVPNTLEAIMRSILTHLSNMAQEEGGKKLEAMVDNRFNAIDSFLNIYLDAKKYYATVVDGNGQDRRPAAVIARIYEKNEKAICLEFAQTIIREFLPHVPFFRQWREHRLFVVRMLGAIIAPLPERLLNWILRFCAKELIPPQVYALVKTGTAAAQKGNLPFAIAITRAFLEQLQKIQSAEIVEGPLPDSKYLRPVVKLLLQALDLQGCDTPDEIRDKLNYSKSWFGQIRKVSEKKLQESAIEACRFLLKFITSPKNSNELFYRLLQLSNSPFESVPPVTEEDWQNLRNEFEELSKERLRVAGEVFQAVVKKSVNETLHGLPEETIRKMADKIIAKERAEMEKLTRGLLAAQQRVQQKLRSSQELSSNKMRCLAAPKPLESTIANGVVSTTTTPFAIVDSRELSREPNTSFYCLTAPDATLELNDIMEQIKAWQKKMSLEDLSTLPDERQQSIEKSVKPLRRNLYLIFEETAQAKTLQEQLLRRVELGKEIRSMQSCLQKSPRLKSFEKIESTSDGVLQPFLDPLSQLKRSIDSLQNDFEAGERHLQTLKRLDPLLKQFYALVFKWQRTRSTRSLKETRHKIESELNLLPAECQKKIRDCLLPIDTAKRKENLDAAWQQLQGELQQLAQTGQSNQSANRNLMQQEMDQANIFIGQMLKAVDDSISQSKRDIASASASIGEKMNQLRADREKINADPLPKKWFDQTKRRLIAQYFPRVAGIASGALLGATAAYSGYDRLAAATAGSVGSVFAGLVELYEHGIEQPPNKSGRSAWTKVASKIAKKSIVGAVCGLACHATANTMPGLGPIIGPYLGPSIWPVFEGYNAGRDAEKAWTNAIEAEVYKLVITAFDNLYDFVLQEHVWRWCIMDTMNAINTVYRPTKQYNPER